MATKPMPAAVAPAPRRPGRPRPRPPLLLEHLSDEEGWAVLDAAGRKVNPQHITPLALATWLHRRQLAGVVDSLDSLDPICQRFARKGY